MLKQEKKNPKGINSQMRSKKSEQQDTTCQSGTTFKVAGTLKEKHTFTTKTGGGRQGKNQYENLNQSIKTMPFKCQE